MIAFGGRKFKPGKHTVTVADPEPYEEPRAVWVTGVCENIALLLLCPLLSRNLGDGSILFLATDISGAMINFDLYYLAQAMENQSGGQ